MNPVWQALKPVTKLPASSVSHETDGPIKHSKFSEGQIPCVLRQAEASIYWQSLSAARGQLRNVLCLHKFI